MKDYKIIEVKRSIFEDNDADAERLRQEMKGEGTFPPKPDVISWSRQDNNAETYNRDAEGRDEDRSHGSRYRLGRRCTGNLRDRCQGYSDPYRWYVPSGCGYDETRGS